MIFIIWALYLILSLGSIYTIIEAGSSTEMVIGVVFLIISTICFIAAILYYKKKRKKKNRDSDWWDCWYCDIPFPRSTGSGKSSSMDCTDFDCNPFN